MDGRTLRLATHQIPTDFPLTSNRTQAVRSSAERNTPSFPLPSHTGAGAEQVSDSPHARGLAPAGSPGRLTALPGAVLLVRLPGALALLLVLLLVLLIVKLLDAILVADLQQAGIGILVVGIEGEGDVGGLVERRARREAWGQ